MLLRMRAPATAFLLTPKASAMRDIGMPSAESSRSLVIAGSSQVMCEVGQFVGRRGASFGYLSVLRGCPLLTHSANFNDPLDSAQPEERFGGVLVQFAHLALGPDAHLVRQHDWVARSVMWHHGLPFN